MSLPKQVIIYQVDEVDGDPVYAIASDVSEIEEEFADEIVGIYNLNDTRHFRVERRLS